MTVIDGLLRFAAGAGAGATRAVVRAAGVCSVVMASAIGLAQSVFYVADQETQGKQELFHLDAKSGLATKLSGPLTAGGNVEKVFSDSKGKVAVYLADAEVDGVPELYAVDVKSGKIRKVNDPLPAGRQVFEFAVTPDGSGVVYKITGGSAPYNLFCRNLKTNSLFQITSDIHSAAYVGDFVVSQKGNKVAFLEWQPGMPNKLYLADLRTGSVVHVESAPPDLRVLEDIRFDDQGDDLFYVLHNNVGLPDHESALMHYNAKRGESRAVSPKQPGYIASYSVDSKGKSLVYILHTAQEITLHLVDLKSGLNTILATGSAAKGLFLQDCEMDSKGKFVLYRASNSDGWEGTINLHRLDVKTGLSEQLTNHDEAGERVWGYHPHRNRKQAYYFAYDADQVQEIFRVGLSDGQLPVKISAPTPDGDVLTGFFDRRSRFAVYEWDRCQAGGCFRRLNFINLKTNSVAELMPDIAPDVTVTNYYVPGATLVYGD